MEALAQSKKDAARLRESLLELERNTRFTVKERVGHIRKLQKADGIEIYAIQYTTIHRAAQTDNVAGIKHFVEQGDLEKRDRRGNTALHEAARFGYGNIIEELGQAGAEMNVKNDIGQTPFHLAVSGGHISILETLYDKGGEPTMADGSGATPAHYAAQANRVDILEVLYRLQEFPLKPDVLGLPSNNGQTPAHIAAQFDALEALDYLFRLGVDLSCRDQFGDTPAHKAARAQHQRTLRGLRRIDADFNVANVEEDSANDLIADKTRYWRESGGEAMTSLRELTKLRRDGAISHAEFQKRKAKILA